MVGMEGRVKNLLLGMTKRVMLDVLLGSPTMFISKPPINIRRQDPIKDPQVLVKIIS